MKVMDPQPFIDKIDWELFDRIRAQSSNTPILPIEYTEPSPIRHVASLPVDITASGISQLPTIISGKVQRFGDNIDTDSVHLVNIF
jgi:hypothetical protein